MNNSLSSPPDTSSGAAFTALRRFSRPKTVAEEQCDLCSIAIPSEHRHLLEMEQRRVVCACDPCALCFHGVVDGRYRLIPRDTLIINDFSMSDAIWESLAIPISLAFLLCTSPDNRVVALYPSPAGATESLLTLDAWTSLVDENPVLTTMEPDVQALLVNRVGATRQYFMAPIDACYHLTGLIRMNWQGFSGGEKVWSEINTFFTNIASHAKAVNRNAGGRNDA